MPAIQLALPGVRCHRCDGLGGVRYLGSTLLEGSMEDYHLVHTEVDRHFDCTGCGARWTELKLL